MAKQKATKEPIPKSPKPGFWEAAILPLLHRRALTLALLFIGIGCIRIPLASNELGLTSDEPQHFACGLEYLSRHMYRYETQHPPLARVMTAVLPYLSGARTTGNPDRENEGVGILIHSADPDRFLAMMRIGTLPFFVLAALVVFAWSRWAFDPATAAIATILFTLLPPVMAHAGLATTDMGLAACLGAAYYCALRWAESPTLKRTVLFGLATAAATLTKFTTLVFFPAALGLALAVWYATERPSGARLAQLARERASGFGIAVVLGAVVIWGAYFFHWNRVPAPEFFDGIASVRQHNAEGHAAYLFGKISWAGFWYYFPVVLFFKTPIGFLLLLAAGFVSVWKHRTNLAYTLPTAFALGVLAPAMMGHINIGVRHILPIYLAFSILAAAGVMHLAFRPKPAWLAMALVLWMAVSGALSHPDQIAYFNEFAGSDPERILVDSDLDWNQSSKALARRLKELGATQVNFGVDNGRSQYMETWPGLPKIKPIHPVIPSEGWTAVRPTVEKTSQYGLYYRYPGREPWFDALQPQERVGSMLLYYVAPGTIRQAR